MKDKLTKDDLGCYIHTALRKCCVSTVTSLAYNLVSHSGKGWGLFLHSIFRHLKWDTKEELIESFNRRIEEIRELGYPIADDFKDFPDHVTEKNINEFYCLVLCFSLFNRQDTTGALAFLLEGFK